MNLYSNYDTYLPVTFINKGGNGLTNVAKDVSTTEAKLGGWIINNPNATEAFVQVFFKPANTVNLGVDTPDMAPFKVVANGFVVFLDIIPIDCRFGMSVAATTTETGAVALGTPVTATFFIARS